MSTTEEERTDEGRDEPFTPATEAQKMRVTSIAKRARSAFAVEQVDLIRNTVAKDCTDAELGMFLELAIRYELDPFAGEIYAAKMQSEDGGSSRVAIVVGRNGMTKVAERYDDYGGYLGDVVHENDDFEKLAEPVQRADGRWTQVKHSYGKPRERGEIIGAWVEVYRLGRPPFYFYADREEYLPRSERKLRYSPWGKQESVMMFKCALTTALRHCFAITGVVGEEEIGRQMHEALPPPGPDWGDDDDQAARLKQLFDSANEHRPNAYRPAKIKTLVDSCQTYEERDELIQELVRWHTERNLAVPEEPDPETIEAEAVEVTDDGDVEIPFGETENPLPPPPDHDPDTL